METDVGCKGIPFPHHEGCNSVAVPALPWLPQKTDKVPFVLALGFSFFLPVKTFPWELAPSLKLSRD